MGTTATKAKRSSRKKTARKKSALSTCPVGAAGWCSYPFSVEQLQKRLKAKAEHTEKEAEPELATAGRKSK